MLSNNKYHKLLISLGGLLIFLMLAMSVGYYFNLRISHTTQRLEALHILDDESQILLGEIQKLALISASSDNAAYKTQSYEQTYQNILNHQETVAQLISILQNGGQFVSNRSDMGQLNVAAADDESARMAVQGLQKIWPEYQQHINQLSIQPDVRLNNLVAEYAQTAQPKIKALLDEWHHHNLHKNGELTRDNQILQMVMVAVVVLYFLFFIYFLMRRLEQADVQVDGAMQEIKNIMTTVDAGLFLLDKELTIGETYSQELENLLGQSNLGGKNMMDVIGHLLSDADLQAAHGFIKQLYNPKTKEKLIGTLNPLNSVPVCLSSKRNDNQTRYLGFRFKRIYDNKEISRILVSVSDVTTSVLLAQKAEEQRRQRFAIGNARFDSLI